MKLAAAAYRVEWHNRWNDYVGKLRVWVRTAAEQGAELLVFPQYAALELASLAGEENARAPERVIEALTARIKDVDDLHASLAREFKVFVCAGSAVLRTRDRGVVDRARLFAPDGSAAAQERLTARRLEGEPWTVTPGAARVFETALGKLGILIGDDLAEPRIAAAMASAGAAILLAPGAAETPRGSARLRIAAAARALEARAVVVQAATTGGAEWLPLIRQSHGSAAVIGPPEPGFPDDGVIAAGKADAPGWVFAETELAGVAEAGAAGADSGLADGEIAVEVTPLGAASG